MLRELQSSQQKQFIQWSEHWFRYDFFLVFFFFFFLFNFSKLTIFFFSNYIIRQCYISATRLSRGHGTTFDENKTVVERCQRCVMMMKSGGIVCWCDVDVGGEAVDTPAPEPKRISYHFIFYLQFIFHNIYLLLLLF